MKKIYLLASAVFFISALHAQPVIFIAPGTDLSLSAGTTFSAGGLSIIPSSSFLLNGNRLDQNTTVTHFTANNYVSRVYKFSDNTAPFNGTVQFHYDDTELNGLSEPGLRVNIHNGTSWQSFSSNTNDGTNNFVLTTAITGYVFNELTLADALFTLPLKWGTVSAYRLGQTVKIEWQTMQENNVSHFTVEKTTNRNNWKTVKDNITATNTGFTFQYAATDDEYDAGRILYRIRQADLDGHYTYSPVVTVSARNEQPQLHVYPNPAREGFYISNSNLRDIRDVQLYNNAGVLVKSWITAQPFFEIHNLPAGIYQLRINLKSGGQQHFKISKQ